VQPGRAEPAHLGEAVGDDASAHHLVPAHDELTEDAANALEDRRTDTEDSVRHADRYQCTPLS
jgi:hypothetical protein